MDASRIGRPSLGGYDFLDRARARAVGRVPFPGLAHAEPAVVQRLDLRDAVAGRGRAVGAQLGVAELEPIVVAAADEEAERHRAALVARVDDTVVLPVVEDRLGADIAALDVRDAAEPEVVERAACHVLRVLRAMSDDEFLRGFLACTLDPAKFGHRQHLRAAWLMLRRYGSQEGSEKFVVAIKTFVAKNDAV